MDRPLRRIFQFLTVLFLALVLMLTYWQVVAAPKLAVNPYNKRSIADEMKVERGVITSADGEELAVDRQSGDNFYRVYPQGKLTSVFLGYDSVTYGRAGIERVYDEELSGQKGLLGITNSLDQILGRTRKGADLKLTINMKVQRAAAQALGNRKGAVVALNPETGAIIAMVSYPTYDSNTIDQTWKQLNADSGNPLINRATQGLYPPGSVFKMVVAGAALQEDTVTAATTFNDTGSVNEGGYIVHNFGKESYGTHSFLEAFSKSINTTFAKVGVELGGQRLQDYAERFGFNQAMPFALGGRTSVFPKAASMDKAALAQASFGQGEVLATPLQMALVASAVANGGTIMTPYIVQQVLDYHQTVLNNTSPKVWRTALSAQTAATLKDLMVKVVTSGTGTAAALKNVQVAGKTGTAEVASGEPDAWFAGFAPAEDPQIVVAVLIENGGTGGSVAAPAARQVISAALGL
jgi:peptidoglycan glycosyltransferase